MGSGTASVFTGLGLGQRPRDVHVNQPGGSIYANDLVPGIHHKDPQTCLSVGDLGLFRKETLPFS